MPPKGFACDQLSRVMKPRLFSERAGRIAFAKSSFCCDSWLAAAPARHAPAR
jgi:hypothetical protein